jgi:hypothetical protein
LTASIPFSALAFSSYAWLAAMISPLPAFKWNRYLPALSLLISNLAAALQFSRVFHQQGASILPVIENR